MPSQAQLVGADGLLQELHAHPEASGDEARTADILAAFFDAHDVAYERGIGGHGLIARIGDGTPVLLRSDMDALPGPLGHRCGHDGHMAMLAGALVDWDGGPIAALFQPSEEDGTGMARCLDAIGDVSAAFAIHNVPGHPLGQVLLGPGALASTGLRATITGRPAHAASPHEGDSPYRRMRALADGVAGLGDGLGAHALATLVHMRLGDESYGISPGHGIVCATLRGSDEDVEAMATRWQDLVPDARYERVDPFPETRNDPEALARVEAAANDAGLATHHMDTPFAWSEDFGHATTQYGGALIGLGTGVDHPPLHDERYVFPASLVPHGIRFWRALGGAT